MTLAKPPTLTCLFPVHRRQGLAVTPTTADHVVLVLSLIFSVDGSISRPRLGREANLPSFEKRVPLHLLEHLVLLRAQGHCSWGSRCSLNQ